tara:strand:+ start:307 stop:768 length:462 start_codon:yes stop_codon:yes gene_type:complete
MATTLTDADITITITESITLNGSDQGATNTNTIASINEVSKRIVEVLHTGQVTLVTFGAAIGAGTYVAANVRYVRITNKDNANFVTLNIEGAGSTDFSVRLDPYQSFLIGSDADGGGLVDSIDITGTTLEDLTDIKAQADTATVPLEIFIASA